MKQLQSTLVAFAIGALLAGCGGGGGSSNPIVVAPQPTPTSSQAQYVNLVLSFQLPKSSSSSARRPQYVSPGSTQLVVTVNSVNGGAVPSWVPATTTTAFVFPPTAGSNCTVSGGTATCTVPIAAPSGMVNYTFSAEDGSNNVLSTLTTTLTMVQGVNNTPTVTLQGVVKTVTVSGAALAADTAISAGETLTVTADDASGNQIVNGVTSANYNNPITLTDNDATGQTQLTLNGGAASSSVVTSNPSDVVKLTYTGQAANSFTISASGTGISGGGTISTTVDDITFTGTTDDTAANGGLSADANYGQQTLFFYSASGSQNITGAETGFTNSPFSKQFDLTLSAGCAGIATAGPSPATTFLISASGAPGTCSARLKEHGTGYPITQHTANTAGNATHDGTFWIEVTSSTFTVNSHSRSPR